MFVSEDEDWQQMRATDLLWYQTGLYYGDWSDNGFRTMSQDLDVPARVQHNATWYMHVVISVPGFPYQPQVSGNK